MKQRILLFICAFILLQAKAQVTNTALENSLRQYFQQYDVPNYRPANNYKLVRYELNEAERKLDIYTDESFAAQPFTPDITKSIYKEMRRRLPDPYNTYALKIYGIDKEIDALVPNIYRETPDPKRTWKEILYKGNPWVKNSSKPYSITRGLDNKHLVVWASHGRYFNNDKNAWTWQRPNLFCTNEDLFTQTFVIPYLIPMLENSGAVVYSPRERDWQKREIIVDNDFPNKNGIYKEVKNKDTWQTTSVPGFQLDSLTLYDNQNFFSRGSARQISTTTRRTQASSCSWMPNIPESGNYAVYVSYQTRPNSVSDARYTVYHKGGVTRFNVNQKMGGGTWVYLGTFDFSEGETLHNRVTLSNMSDHRGIVTADAVRFGGGMGNVARGNMFGEEKKSGLPRFLEGARYATQWAGLPYSVYGSKGGTNDYAEDINARPYSANYLCGGSVFMPDSIGAQVPLELSMAVHSDAGYTKDGSIIGTLGICSTIGNNNQQEFSSGVSRLASFDFATLLLSTITHDLGRIFRQKWTQRELYDRNYSETRNPEIPSAIIETLSHQNYWDMKFGHDPNFKFAIARAAYKAALKFVNYMHGNDYVVQPLPVTHFSVQLSERNKVELHWTATIDSLEETAQPSGYVVYTREDDGAFDNGVLVKENTSYSREIEDNVVYSFKVTAVNAGGESFPSETLVAMQSATSKRTLLIVNGFHRLSGPAFVENADSLGFDLKTDIGVSYMNTAGFCGQQHNFARNTLCKENIGNLGSSGNELEGQIIAGNTFDYPYTHGKAIAANQKYSFASCSSEAVNNGQIKLSDYSMVDWIAGLERFDGQSLLYYKALPRISCNKLTAFCKGGGRLLISGAYLGRDMQSDQEQTFTHDILKYTFCGNEKSTNNDTINGLGLKFPIYRSLSEQHYAATSPDRLMPVAPAFAAFAYPSGLPAGIAYSGTDYRLIAIGFPFECIKGEREKARIMGGLLNFLLK
ncbi:MAG: xanthan lyase [Bacteroidaceae bacterium]